MIILREISGYIFGFDCKDVDKGYEIVGKFIPMNIVNQRVKSTYNYPFDFAVSKLRQMKQLKSRFSIFWDGIVKKC